MDGDGEDDEAVPMVIFNLYGKPSIDGGNDGRGARVRSSGRKMRERERGQVRMGSRGAAGAVLYLTPRRGQTRGRGVRLAREHGAGSTPPCRAGAAATGMMDILQKAP